MTIKKIKPIKDIEFLEIRLYELEKKAEQEFIDNMDDYGQVIEMLSDKEQKEWKRLIKTIYGVEY